MPELPEVQTVVETLGPAVLGRRIERFELFRPDFAEPVDFDWAMGAQGRRIAQISRRAKRIVFVLDDGGSFFAHLGMTGRLTFGPLGRPRARHTHVCITLDHGEIHFVDARRFGGLRWLPNGTLKDDLGPEPLEMRVAELARQLALTRRAIKTALLDQRLLAGLGNIYADEALFAAAIHPLHPANQLKRDEIARLNRAIKYVLRKAIRHRGSTLRDYVDAGGNAGGFARLHRVYGREGEPCSNCGKRIRRIIVGGRSTHYCPACQPARGARRRTGVN